MVHCTMPKPPELLHCTKAMAAVGFGLVRCAATTVSSAPMRWSWHYPTCQRRYSCLRIVLAAQYNMGVSRPDLSLAEHIQNQLAASVHRTYRNSRSGPGSSQSAILWRMSWNTEQQLSLKASRTSFIRKNF